MKEVKYKLVKYCDWLIGVFLILFVFWSPISITGTQAAVSFAVLFWLFKMFLMKKFDLVRNPLNIPIAAFLVVAAIGVITAIDLKHSLKGYMTLSWIFIFFLTVNNVRDVTQFKKLMGILVLIITIAGAYGIFQHFTRIDFFGNVKYLQKTLARSNGFFDSPQTFGNYMLLAFPTVIGLSFYTNKVREKCWLQLSSLIILAAIIFSYVRGVWLGLIGGLIFMSILRSRKFLLSVVGTIMAVILLLAALPSLKFTRRVMETFKSERPVGDRIYLLEGSLNIIRDYPITGVGWEGFRKVYPRYKLPETGKVGCNAHNNFLDVAVDSGLLGLGIFLWFLVTIYKVGFHIFKKLEEKYLKGVVWGFLGSFTAFLIAGLSQYNFGDSEVVMLFYFLLGMVMVIPRIKEVK